MVIRVRAPSPTALLPGEARQSDLVEDAAHWAAVYHELTAFLLRSCGERPETVDRFLRRRDYWRRRLDELTCEVRTR